jgi:hypothetical protein
VAMHLIQKKLVGTDIPATLPPSLVPPSMRASNTSPFSPPISHHPPEPAKDLLWDDTPPTSAAPSQPSRSTLLSHAPTSAVARDPFASSALNGTSIVSSLPAIPLYLNHPQHHLIGIYSVMMMISRALPLLCMISLQRSATLRTNSTQPLAHWIVRRMNEQRLSKRLRLRHPNFLLCRPSSPRLRLHTRQRQNY